MSTLASALAALTSTPATPAAQPAPPATLDPKDANVAATALVTKFSGNLDEARVYALAASTKAATPELRWQWRVVHAVLAGVSASAADYGSTVLTWMPGRSSYAVLPAMERAEARTAQIYAALRADARAERQEILAERLVTAIERIVAVAAPTTEPAPEPKQLDPGVEARFAAIEAAQTKQNEVLDAILAKLTTP